MALTATVPTRWEALRPYLEESGSNSFVGNLVRGVTQLYGNGETEINRGNWEFFDEAVRNHHRDKDWARAVVEKANIKRIVTDSFLDPVSDPRLGMGEGYDAVLRINAFAFGWHPDAVDHNGNSGQQLLKRLGLTVSSFDDYCEALRSLASQCAGRHQVAFKNALAYDRDVSFDPPNEELARQAWGVASPSPDVRKAFGDYIVDLFCRIAAEHDMPMQVHLGTALIRGSHPMNLAGLVERHPKTRFLLMHLAYPRSRDLLGMAFVYRNVWLDLCWSFLLSPSHFKLAFAEAIEVLPDESRMMIGGDCVHVEETFAAIRSGRSLVGSVLSQKVQEGYFSHGAAERLARRVLSENADKFFRLG